MHEYVISQVVQIFMQASADYRVFTLGCVSAGVVLVASAIYLSKKVAQRKRLGSLRSFKPTIAHVILYPIKGCRGVERYSTVLTNNGIAHDREFAVVVVDEGNRCKSLSQVNYPKLALVEPSMPTEAGIHVSAPGMEALRVETLHEGRQYTLDFWGDEIEVVDQGDKPSEWFSKFLDLKCRLVRVMPGMNRRKLGAAETKESSLFFRTPILVASLETMSALTKSVGVPIHYSRFRPNVVVSGLPTAFEEDRISSWSTKDFKLEGKRLCDRCTVPGVNPETGVLETHVVAKMRGLRNGGILRNFHPKYISKLKESEYYVAVYCEPEVNGGSSRICVGQELVVEF